jgi:uncharacterized repeat protein (TIGR01451 family)
MPHSYSTFFEDLLKIESRGIGRPQQVGFDKDVTSMNRFGIRLAAGLTVLVLGGLAIVQAQRDKNEHFGGDWPSPADVGAGEPPAPLGISGDWPAPPDGLDQPLVRGNDSLAGSEAPKHATHFEDSDASQGPSTSPGGEIQLTAFDAPAPLAAEGSTSSSPVGNGGNAPAFAMPSQVESEETAEQQSPAAFAPPVTGGNEVAVSSGGFDAPSMGPASGPAMRLTPLPTATAGSENNLSTPAPGSTASEQDQEGTNPAPAFAPPTSFAAGYDDNSAAAAPSSGVDGDANQEGAGDFALAPLPAETGQDSNDPLVAMAPVGSGYAPPTDPAASPESSNATQGDAQASVASNWGPPTEDPSNQLRLDAAGAPTGSAYSATGQNGTETAAPAPTLQSAPTGASSFAAGSTPGSPQNGSPRANARAASYEQRMNPVESFQTIDAREVLAEPGTRDLEGAQAPSIIVQKRAPAEIRVGKPAEFLISVKNVGTVAALDVRVFDTVPAGTELESTVPQADTVQDLLVWQLGDLRPGEERALTVSIIPRSEGEIGSVARVTFEAAASVRTVATQPNVELIHRTPPQVLIGQQIEVELEISNSGSGTAENVIVMAELPDGLETPNGRSLKLPVGAMPKGDMRRHLLSMRATKPGPMTVQLTLSDADGVINTVDIDVEVIAPRLEVALDGPSLRYLERQATYKVQVANMGTADASDIDLVVYLDRGLKFVSTDFEGAYNPNNHSVAWSLAELKANEVGEVPLTLLPVVAGVQKVRLETTGALGLAAQHERELTIDTLAELSFTIADDQDPIEPGSETVYEIRVRNTGSRDDTNVVLELQIPYPGLQLVTAEPSAGTDGKGKVIFAPIAKIPAKGEQIYRVRVQGVAPDTHVIRATVASAQSKRPVTKEESTTVYADQ